MITPQSLRVSPMLWFWGCPGQGQELDSIILLGPFQLSRFFGKKKTYYPITFLRENSSQHIPISALKTLIFQDDKMQETKHWSMTENSLFCITYITCSPLYHIHVEREHQFQITILEGQILTSLQNKMKYYFSNNINNDIVI